MIPPVAALGPQAYIAPIGNLAGAPAQQPASTTSAANPTGFSGVLTSALNSLQQTQTTADQASQALATGQVTDPTQAVTAVEHAQLAMELASQISTKAMADVQTIFNTQV